MVSVLKSLESNKEDTQIINPMESVLRKRRTHTVTTPSGSSSSSNLAGLCLPLSYGRNSVICVCILTLLDLRTVLFGSAFLST